MKNKTPQHFYQMFDEEIMNVWRNAKEAVDFESIRINIREQNILMSIRCGHRNRRYKAVGLSLLYKISDITLFISPRVLEFPENNIKALMRHEALHFGYPRHDKNFRYCAKKVNAPLSELDMNNSDREKIYTVFYQLKKGARFIKIKDFNDKNEAIIFSKKYCHDNLVKTRVRWYN